MVTPRDFEESDVIPSFASSTVLFFEVFDFELSDADMAQIAGLDRGGRVGAHPDEMHYGAPS